MGYSESYLSGVEHILLETLRRFPFDRNEFLSSFWLLPFDEPVVYSEYGMREYPPGKMSFHPGVDLIHPRLAREQREKILITSICSQQAKVFLINEQYTPGSGGKYVFTQFNYEGKEYVAAYFHLKTIHVKVGQIIEGGASIGYMGRTGVPPGSQHLHLGIGEVARKPIYKIKWKDPLEYYTFDYIEVYGKSYKHLIGVPLSKSEKLASDLSAYSKSLKMTIENFFKSIGGRTGILINLKGIYVLLKNLKEELNDPSKKSKT